MADHLQRAVHHIGASQLFLDLPEVESCGCLILGDRPVI